MEKTVKNGKGAEWRKGTNYKRYRESDFWKSLEEKKKNAKEQINNSKR